MTFAVKLVGLIPEDISQQGIDRIRRSVEAVVLPLGEIGVRLSRIDGMTGTGVHALHSRHSLVPIGIALGLAQIAGRFRGNIIKLRKAHQIEIGAAGIRIIIRGKIFFEIRLVRPVHSEHRALRIGIERNAFQHPFILSHIGIIDEGGVEAGILAADEYILVMRHGPLRSAVVAAPALEDVTGRTEASVIGILGGEVLRSIGILRQASDSGIITGRHLIIIGNHEDTFSGEVIRGIGPSEEFPVIRFQAVGAFFDNLVCTFKRLCESRIGRGSQIGCIVQAKRCGEIGLTHAILRLAFVGIPEIVVR